LKPFLEHIEWVLLAEIVYLFVVIAVAFRIIHDTRSTTKTLAYLLLILFIPVVGILFYFSFGINYRKRKMYNKKLLIDESLKKTLKNFIEESSAYISNLQLDTLKNYQKLVHTVANPKSGNNRVLPNETVKVVENGENLFPLLLAELQKAEHHIHFEYYIYEDDTIGNAIKEVLIEKAKEGITVRFIYDDFGSSRIRKTIVKELREAGVQAFPFHKIRLLFLANRINYRNHRKIIIIDGKTSFVGGLNISDRYNNPNSSGIYWRDTHLMIQGYSTFALQGVFLSDWNFCSDENLLLTKDFFPKMDLQHQNSCIQIVSSGPDSDLPNILLSVIQAIQLAQKEILLTTPYFIPDDTLQEVLILAALSGIEIKLLVPMKADSKLVSLASQSFFEELLAAGVRIYFYQKGFIHAKTFVIDRKIASIGTANLDLRSFDLNFEVSALIYDEKIANQMAVTFHEDLENSEEIILEKWMKRSKFTQIKEQIIRLLSPFM
jgi:cardiolipin synthase